MKLIHLLAALPLALAQGTGSLEQITSFGDNPSGAKMYIYVPSDLASPAPVVVAVHYCTGTAEAYFNGSPYRQLADDKGFIVVYPESPYEGTCWDVSSRETLTHGGGGNSNSIANMVKYVVDNYEADEEKIFVTGSSSGAMMTNVLAATYPDIFAAGIVYNGVPAGCFFTDTENGWNSTCSSGQVISTPERWAQWVTDAYPGYDGPRPRMQIYHGSTDSTLAAENYGETIKQWCGVFGCDPDAPDEVGEGVPEGGYTTSTYAGGDVVGVWAEGIGHTVPIRGDDDMAFFGL